MYNSENITGIR